VRSAGGLPPAIEEELKRGLEGLLGQSPRLVEDLEAAAVTVYAPGDEADTGGEESFRLRVQEDQGQLKVSITSAGERGLLYGTFAFLRALQLGQIAGGFESADGPRTPLRLLNHWDNLDGSIERGYAGRSIFFQDNRLVEDLDRVRDYARLLASIGINGVVVNNVNVSREATELIGSKAVSYTHLAAIFRVYGIRLFLSINFASPLEFGLDTADPVNSQVQNWWKERAAKL